MKCTCPKCHTNVELAVPEITEQGTSATCPSCKATFRVQRESFAGRAMRRSGEISCATCGHDLGPDIRCEACGAVYPDYIVAGARRKEAASKGPKFKLTGSKKQTHGTVVSLEEALREDGRPAAKQHHPATAGRRVNKQLVLVLSLLVLLVVAAAGAATYAHKKAETSYMKSFALATYGVQVEVDKSRKICQKIAAEWKAKNDAGQSYTPRASADDEKDLNSIKSKLESVKGKLSEEPEKFRSSNDKLAKLEASANRMRSLALSGKADSLQAFNDSINKIDAEYKQVANEFKAGLAPELMNELVAASQNFRGLRPLLKSS